MSETERLKQLEELLLAINKKSKRKSFKEWSSIIISLSALASTIATFYFAYTAQENHNNTNKDMQFTNVLFTHYVGQQSCNKQNSAEKYLWNKFKDDFEKAKDIIGSASTPKCSDKEEKERSDLRQIITEQQAKQKKKDSVLNSVQELEKEGFNNLLNGQLSEAKSSFVDARNKYPTYHNVDEIIKKVLTEDRLTKYDQLDKDSQYDQLIEIYKEIIQYYSWGMPADLKQQMKEMID